ncbi:MAG: pyridoxamine 5'-phosphate oxidase family protein [Dehalococcoidia bacterium]
MATSLTPEETKDLLENQRTVILATLKKDGAPVMHALWFTYLDDAIYFNIQEKSFKRKNIARDNRVSCLVEAGETYFELRGVMIQGRCTPVEDAGEMERVQQAMAKKNERIGSGTEELPAYFSESRTRRLSRGDRVTLKVSMDKVTTWDFSKVREHYQRSRS